MVNYKRVVCEVVLLGALVALTHSHPAADCPDRDRSHYDQRQNGTENYRLNIDGVVIAVAPADSLLSAAADFDISDLLDIDDYDTLKPPSKPQKPENKPDEVKPDDVKPQGAKPEDTKPGDVKPEDSKPEDKPDAPLSDVSMPSEPTKAQKKEAHTKKQEKAHRLKMRLANMLLPLLRKNRHH